MEDYLTYAPYCIFVLWIYIVIENFKSLKQVKKASDRPYLSFLNPFSRLQILQEQRNNAELEIAYKNHKKKSRKLFILWVASVVGFLIISIIVGILSEYFGS